MTKIFNVQWNDCHVPISIVLWAYRTICKERIGQTSFKSVYRVEAVMPMEYIVPSLCIVALIDMMDHKVLEEQLTQLMDLEED